jgi:alpha-N-arabinofuranosidase
MYRGSVWLKGANAKRQDGKTIVGGPFPGQIRVSLEEDTSGGKVYACKDFSQLSAEWHRYEFELPVDVDDGHARYTVQLIGQGAVWVDQASLMPSDSKGGIRADVFEKILALRPAFIRWPGGNVAQDYHWEWGIGPRDERPIWVNMSWSNDAEPSDFGTNEFIAFCRAVGAEPTLVVNVEGRGATVQEAAELSAVGRDVRTDSRQATAQEAANWVEYCNGPVTSKYGALRARDGHPKPYRVKFWEIGNELFGNWVRGYSSAATYAANARRYIQAMRAVDPTIQVIAVGDENMEWNKEVLREIGPEIDYLAVHHYYADDEKRVDKLNWFARPLWVERLYGQIDALIRQLVPGHPVKLAVNEWNTSLPLPRQHSMESALFGARLLNVMLRRGDLVAMSAVSDLVNGWTGGIIQASRRRVFTTPTYSVIRAYNEHLGTWRIACETQSASTFSPNDPALGKDIPALDAVATTNADGSEIYLMVVNTDVTRSGRTKIEVAGTAKIFPGAEVQTINGPTLEATNTFEAPERIAPRTSALENASNSFVYSFGKHSVTLLTLHTKK